MQRYVENEDSLTQQREQGVYSQLFDTPVLYRFHQILPDAMVIVETICVSVLALSTSLVC
jgi:hypothetical protein